MHKSATYPTLTTTKDSGRPSAIRSQGVCKLHWTQRFCLANRVSCYSLWARQSLLWPNCPLPRPIIFLILPMKLSKSKKYRKSLALTFGENHLYKSQYCWHHKLQRACQRWLVNFISYTRGHSDYILNLFGIVTRFLECPTFKSRVQWLEKRQFRVLANVHRGPASVPSTHIRSTTSGSWLKTAGGLMPSGLQGHLNTRSIHTHRHKYIKQNKMFKKQAKSKEVGIDMYSSRHSNPKVWTSH